MHLSDPVDLIPEDGRPKVRSALAATFGGVPVTALHAVTAGASALSYRLEVAGRPYLLRVESLRRDEVRDPHRSYPCMGVAVAAGLAPALHYADPATGVAIMDFVRERPRSEYPGGAVALARDLGTLVARLQETAPFPAVSDYLTVLKNHLDRLLASGMFAPGLLHRHQEGFELIRAAYPWDSATLVSSHNDLNPQNILFDGERLWLIDWETAYRNDPLVDISTLILFLARVPELEQVLLRSWLGREPARALRSRLALVRLLVRLFYGCAASLNAAHTLNPVVPATDLVAPTPEQFVDLVQQGRLTAGSPEGQRIVGKMALAGFMADIATPEFEEALAVVRWG